MRSSYRYSHIDKGHGSRYDSDLFSEGRYDFGVWQIEKWVLKKLICKYFHGIVDNYIDFACGTGRITCFMEKFCKNSIGIDISEDMLSLAKSLCKNSTFLLIDITTEKVISKNLHKINLVTAFRFFLNAEPDLRRKTLVALHEILCNEGYLIFNIHGVRNSLLFIVDFARRLLGLSVGNSLLIAEVYSMLEECGFKIIDMRSVCYLPRIVNRFLPQKLWVKIEKFLVRIKVFNKFGIYRIFVAKKCLY